MALIIRSVASFEGGAVKAEALLDTALRLKSESGCPDSLNCTNTTANVTPTFLLFPDESFRN